MTLSKCLMSKGDKRILLQGVRHVGSARLYKQLLRIEARYESMGYLIIKELVDTRPYENTDSEIVKNFIRFVVFAGKMYENMSQSVGELYQGETFPVKDLHVALDVPVDEYAMRLHEAGFYPDMEMLELMLRCKGKSRQETLLVYKNSASQALLKRKQAKGSWREVEESALESIKGFRDLKAPMIWREGYIVNEALRLLEEREAPGAVLFYGNFHIHGLKTQLLQKGWQKEYQRNLKPRYD